MHRPVPRSVPLESFSFPLEEEKPGPLCLFFNVLSLSKGSVVTVDINVLF